MIFSISSVSELADYKTTYEVDTDVVKSIAALKEQHPSKSKIAILNLDATYVEDGNFTFHEHVTGVTESSWALTGAVRCYNNNQTDGIQYIPMSLKKDYIYKKWEYSTKNIKSMDKVYYYDFDNKLLLPILLEQTGTSFELYFENGEKLGTIVEENENGIFLNNNQ